jgi:anthranilate synthase component 2
LKHREYKVWGVQFHPESVLTEHGASIIKNWVED